jgi:hypothetical protein
MSSSSPVVATADLSTIEDQFQFGVWHLAYRMVADLRTTFGMSCFAL